MSKGSNLGEFEQTVLFTLARFDGDVTGRDVYRELKEVTGRDVSLASVHVALKRLGAKGVLDTSTAPGPEGLGRTVRHFAVNRAGRMALAESRAHWERLWSGVDLGAELGGE